MVFANSERRWLVEGIGGSLGPTWSFGSLEVDARGWSERRKPADDCFKAFNASEASSERTPASGEFMPDECNEVQADDPELLPDAACSNLATAQIGLA
jgi:hypothetical protein